MYFQLYMDFFIQNHCLCQRYSIESSYPKYIPININHRLVTYNNSNVGLNSIVDEYMQSKGKDQQRELYDYINRVNVAVTRRREQLTSDELFGSFCESNVLQQYLYISFIRVNRKQIVQVVIHFRLLLVPSKVHHFLFLQCLRSILLIVQNNDDFLITRQQSMPFSNYVMNLEDGSFTLYHLSTVNQVSKDSFGNLKNKKAIPFRLTYLYYSINEQSVSFIFVLEILPTLWEI